MDLSRGTSFEHRSHQSKSNRRVTCPARILGFILAFALYHIFYIGGNWTFVQRYTSVDSPRSAKKVAFLFAGLYLISPILWMLPPIPPLWAKVAILMAAMPSGASSFVLAGKGGRWAMELSAWAVMLTTTLASISLIGILWWLGA